MTKVKALEIYEKYQIKDKELNRVPKKDEEFEVTEKRLRELLGDNKYKKVFVEVIEEPEKVMKSKVKQSKDDIMITNS